MFFLKLTMFRHFPPYLTMLLLFRIQKCTFFVYTTCLSDPVEKSSKLDFQGMNSNPNNPQLMDVEKKRSIFPLLVSIWGLSACKTEALPLRQPYINDKERENFNNLNFSNLAKSRVS